MERFSELIILHSLDCARDRHKEDLGKKDKDEEEQKVLKSMSEIRERTGREGTEKEAEQNQRRQTKCD